MRGNDVVEPNVEIIAGGRTFRSGLLVEIVRGLRRVAPGEVLAIVGPPGLDADLRAWSALTGHVIVEDGPYHGQQRWIIRHGAATGQASETHAFGSRLWLYSNFDCNLSCDYCCVRSSPSAARRALGLERVQRIAREAPPLGVREFFLTGGEPFILSDIGAIIRALADAAAVTVLTNGMLFRGSRLAALRMLPRDRVTLQISLDSPTPELHDRHRGAGSWEAAWRGVQRARSEGFRVRLAASVSSADEEERFRQFLDTHAIAPFDRVIRRIARRGFAKTGVVVTRADLIPELTITALGVYWHPVGAEDTDLLVTTEIFPLSNAFDQVRIAFARSQEYGERLATVFHCA